MEYRRIYRLNVVFCEQKHVMRKLLEQQVATEIFIDLAIAF